MRIKWGSSPNCPRALQSSLPTLWRQSKGPSAFGRTRRTKRMRGVGMVVGIRGVPSLWKQRYWRHWETRWTWWWWRARAVATKSLLCSRPSSASLVREATLLMLEFQALSESMEVLSHSANRQSFRKVCIDLLVQWCCMPSLLIIWRKIMRRGRDGEWILTVCISPDSCWEVEESIQSINNEPETGLDASIVFVLLPVRCSSENEEENQIEEEVEECHNHFSVVVVFPS